MNAFQPAGRLVQKAVCHRLRDHPDALAIVVRRRLEEWLVLLEDRLHDGVRVLVQGGDGRNGSTAR
jgi:hypothetical protein